VKEFSSQLHLLALKAVLLPTLKNALEMDQLQVTRDANFNQGYSFLEESVLILRLAKYTPKENHLLWDATPAFVLMVTRNVAIGRVTNPMMNPTMSLLPHLQPKAVTPMMVRSSAVVIP